MARRNKDSGLTELKNKIKYPPLFFAFKHLSGVIRNSDNLAEMCTKLLGVAAHMAIHLELDADKFKELAYSAYNKSAEERRGVAAQLAQYMTRDHSRHGGRKLQTEVQPPVEEPHVPAKVEGPQETQPSA